MAETRTPAHEAKSDKGSHFDQVLEFAGELPEGAQVPASQWGAVVSVLAHGTAEARKIVDDAQKSAEEE